MADRVSRKHMGKRFRLSSEVRPHCSVSTIDGRHIVLIVEWRRKWEYLGQYAK